MGGSSKFGGSTVQVDAAGALTGDGSVGTPLAVGVDGVTVTIVNDVLVAPTGGGGTIGGNLGGTDNVVPRADGVGGATLQASAVSIDDAGVMSGLSRLMSQRVWWTSVGGNTQSYTSADSSWEMDFPDGSSYLAWDATTHRFSLFMTDGVNTQHFDCDPSRQITEFFQNVQFDGTVTTSTVFTGDPNGYVGEFTQISYASTIGVASDVFTTSRVSTTPGSDGNTTGVAVLGTIQNHASSMNVAGSGSADNEFAVYVGGIRADIGTGYTQSAGPVGRLWGSDQSLHGPIAVQPDTLNGFVQFINQYYNGSPADSPSGAVWITTQRGAGGSNDAPHAAANTYPVDVGLGITGFSNAGTDAVGFTTAIQIGGSGDPWGAGQSIIGTGISISDCTGPDVASTGFWQLTEMTAPSAGAANTCRLYVEDDGAGKTRLMALFSSGAAQQVAIEP